MEKTLPTRGYKLIISLLLLLLAFKPPGMATPECPIITGTFPFANGTTVSTAYDGWYLDASKVVSTGYFAVKSNRIMAENLGGEGVWYSNVFSVAGYTDFQAAVKITAEGNQNSSEYVKIYYKINGGAETLLDQRTGNFGTIDFTSPVLTGSTIQLVVRIYDYNNGSSQTSKYYIEQYRVFREKGPCGSAISVTATAGNSGILTCANPSLTLSASSTATGVTYSWTGPNSFTSTSQNPVVSTAGTYTVVGTSTAGSGSTTVVVTENKTAPDISATGGSLACFTSVTLNANTSVANATYSWTGPSSFTSTAKSPVVTTAGTYTVTVKNPVNGCTASQSVTVASGTASQVDFWTEDFTLSDGTTTDNGTTSWTSTKPTSSSLFSVLSNAFRTSGTGLADGVWSSAVMTITGKTNVKVSADCRSAVLNSSVVMNDSGELMDYIRFYYKLNGGAEVLFAEKDGTINNHSTTYTNVSLSGLSGNTLQIVVRARATGTDEFYYFDNVKMAGVDPAVTLATAVSRTVTCANSAQITVTPSGTVSSYAWTGPNGFTSTAQNPTVTAGGQYVVTATLPSGCTVSTSVTVAEDKAAPDLSASGGSFGCLTSIVINASTSIANPQYSWTGPSGFTSTLKNPTVSTAGTYTVTVTNPVNGCTATQSVQVSAGVGTPSAFWWEDFTLANGTVVDNGATSWSVVNTGSGTYSVQNNEFKVSYSAAAEGVWNSAVVDISGKSNVVISTDLRSETASSSDAFETDDYVRVYYKLNGGAETLVYEDLAGIGTTTTGTASVTINSAALNGSTLQVVIKTRNSDVTERYFFDNVKLTGTDVSNVDATATVSGPLTCSTTSVTLAGSSTVPGVTYSWTGPSSFTSALQNPVVTAAGDYILKVTAPGTGCTANATATVIQNITVPNLSITKPDTLSCTKTTVNLVAASTTASAIATWTGFPARQKTVSVSAPGKYYVTVTDTISGCTKLDSVTVIQNITVPNLTKTTPAALSCTATSVSLTAASTTTGATITWTGFAAGQNPVSVTAPGKYYVTASTANGCSKKDSVTVTQDITVPNLTVTTPAVLTCAVTSVNLTAASTTSGAVITWAGGYNVGQSTISVSVHDKYYVTATGTNGCIKKDSVTVTQDTTIPTLTVTTPAALTCSTTSVNLTASVVPTSATITWTGFAAGQNPVSVTAPGKYYVTATSANGCIKKDSVTVTQNVTAPNLTKTTPAALTCSTTSVSLTAASTTTGAKITWTGFADGQSTISVTAPGKYYVTASTGTGCTAKDSVTVTQDITKPNLSIVTPGTFSCNTASVSLTANTSTANTTITWSGFTAGQNSVTVYAPGKYYVTARNTVTGCISTDSVTLVQENVTPNLTLSPTSGVLNCNVPYLYLSASSTTPNATITWSGFSPGQTTIMVFDPGTYYVTVRTATGCVNTDSVKVTQDYGRGNMKVQPPGIISCVSPFASLNVTGTDPGAVITWAGFQSGLNPITVNDPGTYYVTVRGANGCLTTDSVKVLQDVSKPLITITQAGALSCSSIAVYLTATSAADASTITWAGNAAGQNTITVYDPGTYYVTVRGGNGCINTDSTKVIPDTIKPTLTITLPDTLSCSKFTTNLTAATTTPGAVITWGGFAAGQNPVTISTPGTYYVSVRGTNGCLKTDSVKVVQNLKGPDLSITQPDILTCSKLTVTLSATTPTTGATITWAGFAAGQSTVTVSAPGKYYVTVRTNTGCTTLDSVTVIQDLTKPNLTTTTPAVLTCATTSVNLTAASTTTGATINWTGFPAGQNPVSVSAPGKYYVTVRSTTGCSTIDSVIVTQDITKPNLTITAPATLTCTTTSVSLNAASTTTGATITWTGFAAGQNPVSVSAPGKYYVTVRSTTGCSTIDSVTVTQDITKPNLTTTAPATLTCSTTSVSLNAASTTTGATITWTGFPAGQNPVSVSAPGKYYVTVRSTTGCSTIDSVTVTQDITKPNLTTTAPAILTCATTSVSLNAASTTTGATITWTGFAAGQNPVSVSAPGKYYVTVRSTTGCSTIDSVTVIQDITKPNLTTTAPATLTCATISVSLNAASTTTGATITWTGFAAGQNPVSVSAPGKYYVTARSTTGCSTIDSVTVIQDLAKPNLTTTAPATLTCTTTSVSLNAASTTTGATITWTGFAAGQNPVSVSAPGKYYVTARSTTGCSTIDSVTVTQDLTKPNLTTTTPDILTCNITSVNLTAASTTTGAIITWAGFPAGQSTISVTAPGKYYVTALSTTGCTTLDSVIVTQNLTKPNLTTTTPATLTCATVSVDLSAASTTTGAIITWTGFPTGQRTISVTAPGKYYVTARSTTGCTTLDSVIVTQDITKPNLTTTPPAILTCATLSVDLKAASATTGATISWTGFPAGQNPVSVKVPGKYYVTATSAIGCTTLDSVIVTQDITIPNLTTTTPATLTCTTVSVNLTAASTTTGAIITWTGFPAGQNPVSVGAPGKYYVTALSPTGCVKFDSVIVLQNITKPDLTITPPATLTCSTTTVNLTASSTTSGTVISWVDFPANQNPISITAPGKYYAIARISTTGCSTIDSVTVVQDISKPDLTITPPATLTCSTISVNLTATSTSAGATFNWSGFAPGQNPIAVFAPGKYYVTVKSATGCVAFDSVTVVQDVTPPSVSITAPTTLTCTVVSVNLTATTTATGATINWTGFPAGQNPISVSAPGTYYVTVRSATGCSAIDSVKVIQDISKPDLTITAPAILTCTTTSVNLTATTTATGATIRWTGFASGQNPVSVSAPGKYYVTVRSTTGCSTIDSVTVIQDITKPNLSTTAPATLTCSTTSVSLNAASTTTGATITWTGFAAGQNPVSVSAPGKYYVTVRSTTGCSTIDSVTVIQDITKPNLSTTAPATLTCATTSVSLNAASTTTGATITWTGFAAGQNPVSVSAPGKYYVTARSTTGCSTIDSVTVIQDITKPNLSTTAPATLTCSTTSVSLNAASTTTGATITWTGFAAGQNPVSVSAPGKYYVTARSTTGCSTIDSVTVIQDITKPNLSTTAPATLTCSTTSVSLNAASTTTGATITWTGFAAGQNPVSVSAPGKYYVTARSTTGCSTIDSVTVIQDITKPNLSTTAPATLTCSTTSVSLNAASTTTGATITWTGFAAGQNPVSVSAPGKYYVTARSTTGCSTIDSVTVIQDITKPNLSTTAPATLTCATTSVSLNAASTTTGATITWTGFAAGQNPVSVSAPGKYYVTARSTTGCSTIDSVTVTQDITKPNLSTTAPATLTCATTSASLNAASTTTGATITWTGFAAGQNPVSVSAPGKYYVTARSTTGCSTIDSVTVTQDITKPNLSTTAPATLTCSTTSVSLNAASTTTGATITWTGFAAGQNPVSVSAPGKYYVTARSTTGCSTIDSVTVIQDITKPNLSTTAPATLTCATTSVSLNAASTTTGATITWTGFAAGQNPVSVSAPGKYYVTARSTTGCSTIDSVTVTQDITKPNLTITAPANLTCATTSVSLNAASTTTGATITWTNFAAGQNPVSVTAAGKYYATALSATGCSTIDSVTVTQDITKPNLTTTAPATLTCTTTSVNLSAASTTTGATITWTGFAAGQNPVSVTAAGKYYVTALSITGCSTLDSVTVTQDITKPDLSVTAPASLTCLVSQVSLEAKSATPNVTFTWTGFTAGQNPVIATSPIKYYVTVKSNANGCTKMDSVTVARNITAPAGVNASNGGAITCIKTSTSITGTSTTTGVSYAWTGPGGFTSNNATATVTTAGAYNLVVVNNANGCSVSANTTVTKNITPPVTVINPPTATLSPLSFDILTARSVTGASYKWTLTSDDVNWAISAGATSTTLTYMSGEEGSSGTFKLKVTDNTNGCSDSTQLVLTVPVSAPTAIAAPAIAEARVSSIEPVIEYNAYPNPFTDKAYITFKSPVTTKVTVEVFGYSGAPERVLFNDQARAGESYKLIFNPADLPSGIHYCVIRTNGKVYTTRLLLVR
ncbi:hypothetical protein SAMN05428988_3649 [Chitinophaga sp. YR573]|uniref:hypothetical protein n=1 Tax=Chitinophaga sp. YR573 TaxID=1881040 RepID=UPI0008B77B32|nr:hypothetical protein [Chitinophaga sp. YR573]SEW25552.1 hypothetical protein SAMN05428988_3649 [Chitinophaga sp. YR573]